MLGRQHHEPRGAIIGDIGARAGGMRALLVAVVMMSFGVFVMKKMISFKF